MTLDRPGFTQATVAQGGETTLIDWATDSAWRFLPVMRDRVAGAMLHPLDVAVNKLLALVGRDEARDYVDILFADATILPLPALVWAAAGKDPGLNPASTVAMFRRRGRPHPADIDALDLVAPFDLEAAKTRWLAALDEADAFVAAAPRAHVGCLFYDQTQGAFVHPTLPLAPTIVPHHGTIGGVLPVVASAGLTARAVGAPPPTAPYPVARDEPLIH